MATVPPFSQRLFMPRKKQPASRIELGVPHWPRLCGRNLSKFHTNDRLRSSNSSPAPMRQSALAIHMGMRMSSSSS
ncbi:hypothetical protein D3C86_2133430 [compost metagenome]